MVLDLNQPDFGFMGECYVQFELARRGIRTVPLPTMGFEYDLLASNGTRIEVKTSNLSPRGENKRMSWNFTNKSMQYVPTGKDMTFTMRQFKRDRQCDVFVFVCVIDDEVNRVYVVPKASMGTRYTVTMYRNPGNENAYRNHVALGSRWDKWINRWDVIERFGRPDEVFVDPIKPAHAKPNTQTAQNPSQKTLLDGP